MLCSNVHLKVVKDKRKRKVVYHRQTDDDLEQDIMVNELRGVVYMIKQDIRLRSGILPRRLWQSLHAAASSPCIAIQLTTAKRDVTYKIGST